MNEPKTTVTVYIYLLDEGVDVWRPVEAEAVKNDLYRIISNNPDPEDEKWQFSTGDVVHCVEKTLMNRKPEIRLVAVSKADSH